MAKPQRPRLFMLLERAAHAVRQRLERRTREEVGVTMAQLAALFYVASNEECLQKDLAAALGVQPAAVTGMVDRLEIAGMVSRTACSQDGRAQRLKTTAAGKRVAAESAPMAAAMQVELVKGFTEEEIEVVARFLQTAIDRELY